jgi:hypothetical protein
MSEYAMESHVLVLAFAEAPIVTAFVRGRMN